MRKFEKISFEQFKKDVIDDNKLYDNFKLPYRKTTSSAGYDILLLFDYNIKPGKFVKIPTGIKIACESDETMLLFIRSSLGYKYNLRLVNQVGVVDADYYNNIDNEGHLWIKVQNEGDAEINLVKDSAIAQGVFIKYLITESEDTIKKVRKGGIGSTDE